jgi:hypothetical protein
MKVPGVAVAVVVVAVIGSAGSCCVVVLIQPDEAMMMPVLKGNSHALPTVTTLEALVVAVVVIDGRFGTVARFTTVFLCSIIFLLT